MLNLYFLQQSDGNTIRVPSSGATPTSQTLVLSNIGKCSYFVSIKSDILHSHTYNIAHVHVHI